MAIQKNAYVDVNPVIMTFDCKRILAKRAENVVEHGLWHLPGGRVLPGETFEATLKRVAFTKTNLEIELSRPTLKESLVGIYDNPKRDPREHVIGLAFLCKIVGGTLKPGKDIQEVRGFTKLEIENLRIAFDHRRMVEDASTVSKKRALHKRR